MKIPWFVLAFGLLVFACATDDSGKTREEYRSRRMAFLDSLAFLYQANNIEGDSLLYDAEYTIDFERAFIGRNKGSIVFWGTIKDIRKDGEEYTLCLNAQTLPFYNVWVFIKCHREKIIKIIESPRNSWEQYAIVAQITKVYRPTITIGGDCYYDKMYDFTVFNMEIEDAYSVILEGSCIDIKKAP